MEDFVYIEGKKDKGRVKGGEGKVGNLKCVCDGDAEDGCGGGVLKRLFGVREKQ